jgi:hypothetical protein
MAPLSRRVIADEGPGFRRCRCARTAVKLRSGHSSANASSCPPQGPGPAAASGIPNRWGRAPGSSAEEFFLAHRSCSRTRSAAVAPTRRSTSPVARLALCLRCCVRSSSVPSRPVARTNHSGAALLLTLDQPRRSSQRRTGDRSTTLVHRPKARRGPSLRSFSRRRFSLLRGGSPAAAADRIRLPGTGVRARHHG